MSATDETPTGRRAEMPIAGEYLHNLLNLPPDTHIVGFQWEPAGISSMGEFGNVVIFLEAFADDTFPSPRVTANFHQKWDVKTGKNETVFDGFESID